MENNKELIEMKAINLTRYLETDIQINLFNSIIDRLFEAVLIIDNDYTVTYANTAAEQLYGYTETELIGKTIAELNWKMITAGVQREDISDIFNRGETWSGLVLGNKKGGCTFSCEFEITPHYNDEGKIITYICVQSDVAKNRYGEQLHKEIMEAAVDGFIMRNIKGKMLEVNDSYCRMMGYTRKELLTMSVSDMEGIENSGDITRRIQKVKRERHNCFEAKHKHKDGHIIYVLVTDNYLNILEGRIFTFIRNITEKKMSEKALIESEMKYRDLYDNAPVTYLTIENDGSIIQSNMAAQNWLGYSAEELENRNILEIYEDGSMQKAKFLLEQFKQGALTENEEMVYLKKDGKKVHGLLSVSPLIGPDNNIIASRCIVKDITERKQLDELKSQYGNHLEKLVKKRTTQLSRANKKLETMLQQQIESAKQRIDFTNALVHELKTPLTAVLSSSEIMVKEINSKMELRLARNIYKSAINLDRRIDELLDLARSEVGILKVSRRTLNTLDLIYEVADEMRPEATNKGHAIILDVPSSLPFVLADEERIRQILLNLISNALKFNSDKGSLIIRARAKDGYVLFEVQDEGQGLQKDEQKKIFQPYYRGKSDRDQCSGLGIGLALSKTLVELHQGKIWVKSQKGKGSIFGFSIPIASFVSQYI